MRAGCCSNSLGYLLIYFCCDPVFAPPVRCFRRCFGAYQTIGANHDDWNTYSPSVQGLE